MKTILIQVPPNIIKAFPSGDSAQQCATLCEIPWKIVLYFFARLKSYLAN
jgi:hypothetical protein